MSIYNPSIPTGLINLDTDYKNIQNNFSQLDTSYGVDHYKYSDNTANNGKHNIIHIPTPQAASPGTGSLEWAEYTKSVGPSVEIFWQRPNIIAGGADIQMTMNIQPGPWAPTITAGTGTAALSYITFLPGGFFRAFGFISNVTPTSGTPVPSTLTFPAEYSFTGVFPQLQVSLTNAALPTPRPYITAVTNTSFSFEVAFTGASASVGIYWSMEGFL